METDEETKALLRDILKAIEQQGRSTRLVVIACAIGLAMVLPLLTFTVEAG